jgi:uncharacterized protein (DUF2147 family)
LILFRTLLAALCFGGVLVIVPAAMADIDTPVGSWLRADGKTVFVIEPCGTGLCGRIAGFPIDNPSAPPPRDWRGQPICNDEIIAVVPEYGIRNRWHGTVINPHDGKVWQAMLTLVNGQLHFSGYFGVPLFGRTETWTRYTGEIGPNCRLTAAG